MRWKWFAAAGLVAAGFGLFSHGQRQQRAEDVSAATRLLVVFDGNAALKEQETAAIRSLQASSVEVRAAFLDLLLTGTDSAKRFDAHQQALAIALSRVDRRDAVRLLNQVIAPAIEQSQDPPVLRICFHLVERWGLVSAMPQVERDELALNIVQRIVGDVKTSVRDALRDGFIHLWAGQVGAKASEQAAERLVKRLSAEKDAYTARSLIPVLAVATPQLGVGFSDQLAKQLLEKIEGEFRRERLAPLTAALESLAPRISPRVAGQVAEAMVSRMLLEQEAAPMLAWTNVLGSVREKTEGPLAGKLADALLVRVRGETNSAALDALVSALEIFSKAAGEEQAGRIVLALAEWFSHSDVVGLGAAGRGIEALSAKMTSAVTAEARALAMRRLRATKEAGEAAILGASLGVMPRQPGPNGNEAAAQIVVEFLNREDDVYKLSRLDGALRSLLRGGIEPRAVEQLARIITGRLVRERYLPNLIETVVAFELLADHLPESASEGLAEQVLARMRQSSAPGVVRALAFALGSMQEGARRQQALAALDLKNRILATRDSVALRSYTGGLLNVGEDVSPDLLEEAAGYLASLQARGVDDDGVTASLQAIRQRMGEVEIEPPKESPETVARQLLNPLSEEEAWNLLAMGVAPSKEDRGNEPEEEEDEATADFHVLMVADDDGATDATRDPYPIDFGRLSDFLDRYREPLAREALPKETAAGWTLMVTGLLLAAVTGVQHWRQRPAEE